MKKIIALFLCLTIAAALSACGTSGTLTGDEAEAKVAEIIGEAEKVAEEAGIPAGDIAGLANPMVEYGSLDEINTEVGSALVHPPVMGVTDENFFVINCGEFSIAQYNFAVNGNPYTFRCAPVIRQDISGIYTDGNTAFPAEPTGETIEYCLNGTVQAARWFTLDGQYVFSADEPGTVDDETFTMVAEELWNLTKSGMSDAEFEAYYASLEGSYEDSFSQRAVAEVTANGSDSVTIIVSWSSSAAEHNEWKMTAKLAEDGLLVYNDLEAKVVTYTSETQFTEVPYEFPESGFFSVSEGKLFWNGAGDESCVDCVFEKYEPAK